MKNAQTKIIGFGVTFLILFFIGGVIALLGFDQVEANHLGVKVKLGKITGAMEPGLEWTGLFTQVHQYDLRLRKATIDLSGVNSAVDKTGQAVFSTIDVNYRIKPEKQTVIDLYSKVGPDNVISDRLNIEPIIREGFKQATVKYDALEILDKRQQVKEEAKEFIRSNFPAQYFEISDIVVSNIDFSQEFKNAIEAKKTAEQEALKEENQLEVVKFQQQQEIEKYKAEAEKLRLQRNEISPLLVQQQWVAKWDGKLPQYMISNGETQTQLLNLPSVK